MRRRRVDRAFRAARLLDVPELRRLTFALAAGVVAAELLPTRARARATAAAAWRERAGDAVHRRNETDAAYREVRAAAAAAGPARVRFTFDQVRKADRVLAGLYAGEVLRGGPLSAEARAARDALGPEVMVGLIRMVEHARDLPLGTGGHRNYGPRPLATDRIPLAAGCVVSDDLQSLAAVPWHKISGRSLKKDGDHSRGYDAEVLVWSSVPLAGVAELVCPDGESRCFMEMSAQECGIEITVVEDAAAFF